MILAEKSVFCTEFSDCGTYHSADNYTSALHKLFQHSERNRIPTQRSRYVYSVTACRKTKHRRIARFIREHIKLAHAVGIYLVLLFQPFGGIMQTDISAEYKKFHLQYTSYCLYGFRFQVSACAARHNSVKCV